MKNKILFTFAAFLFLIIQSAHAEQYYCNIVSQVFLKNAETNENTPTPRVETRKIPLSLGICKVSMLDIHGLLRPIVIESCKAAEHLYSERLLRGENGEQLALRGPNRIIVRAADSSGNTVLREVAHYNCNNLPLITSYYNTQ